MAFNINTFKANGLPWGGARPSLFQVELTLPPTLALNPESTRKLAFTCRAAELPESTVSTIEVPYFGRRIKLAGERSFADWSITVMNDEDFSVRSMFEAWHNAINTLQSNVRLPEASFENYKAAAVDIVQFAKDGDVLRSYQLVGAFPTQVSAVTLGWDTQNAIEEFTVSFAYDYWLPVIESTSVKTSGKVTPYGGLTEVGPE